MSWQTLTIILGLIVVVVIVLDGLRRMRKARAEALKLDIKNDFNFPETDDNPELPSGGFRVVGDDDEAAGPDGKSSAANSREEKKRPEKPEIPTMRGRVAAAHTGTASTATSSSAAAHKPAERKEPVFKDLDAGFDGDDLGPVRVRSAVDTDQPVQSNKQHSHEQQPAPETVLETPPATELNVPQGDQLDVPAEAASEQTVETPVVDNMAAQSESRVDASDYSDSGSGSDNDNDNDQMQENIQSWLNTRTREIEEELAPLQETASIIPKARPVDLDEDVPLLMSVESLGQELDMELSKLEGKDVSAASDDSNGSESEQPLDSVDTDTSPRRQTLEESLTGPSEYHKGDKPTLQEEIDMQEEQGEDQGSELVIYANDDAEQLADRAQAEVVLVINAVARDPEGFSGRSLLHLFDGCDLRFGNERIFHRFEEADGKGPIQFSVAQTYEPGIFNPATMEDDRFSGLTFFMSLPGAERPLEAYQAMSEMARVLADHLNAELRDATRSTFTKQTVEHDRQQIQEYERRKALKAKKMAAGKRR